MASETAPRPKAPDISGADLKHQVWVDAYGKEVQSAATYSYMWMADQVGHMCVGILLSFAFITLFRHLPPAMGLPVDEMTAEVLGFLVAAALVSFWEYRAYSSDVKRAHGSYFPLQTDLLKRNAIAAAFYMALGAAIGWALHISWYFATPAILLMLAVGVKIAIPWVRQKIIWQKAALPYLSRLADIQPNMSKAHAEALWDLIIAPQPPAGPVRMVVLGGPVGSGRSEIACSIGTEIAFRAGSARYLPFSHLVEMAQTRDFELQPPLPGPSNIGYWPWSRAQVLIIDDIGPLLARAGHAGDMTPAERLAHLLELLLDPVREALALRTTVWVLGKEDSQSQAELQVAADAIAAYLGVKDPLAILLAKLPTPPPGL